MTTTLPTLIPGAFPGFGESAPLDLPPLDDRTALQVADVLTAACFGAWSEAPARVGNCARPIRLHGGSQTVDPATGEILSTYSSSQEPLGVTHVRCGNRRASECPSCSRLYAAALATIVANYVQECERSRRAVADADLDDAARGEGMDFTLRYAMIHMIQETARHCDHLDLLRERTDGAVGV